MLVSIGLGMVAAGIAALSLEAIGTALTLFAIAAYCVRAA